MSQQSSRAESLFKAAAKLASAEDRAAFLERECASDAELRETVEAMLRERNDAAASFHDAPTLIAPLDATMLLPEPAGEDATIVSAPAHGGMAMPGHTPTKQDAPVTLPEESYAVGGEIARGGMGSILEAEDRKLGRKVAMKVMRLDASASEDARSRFVREAAVLARLEHPNIVPIHELGWDADGRLFYTMKLVQGRTLQAILNGLKARDADFTRYYTLDRLLTIFRKICDALSMAHAKGVIHRDLKPENVMVGEFGEVLVMDWGIAKILGDAAQVAEESARKAEATEAGTAGKFRDIADEELRRGSAELTMDGTVMGTPHYMSPEQAEGRVSEIDQQSDVFSLGAILYALLTLHPPVEASSIREVLERIRQGDIRPPTTFNVTTKGGKGQSLEGAAADPKQFQPLAHCPGGKVPPALSSVAMKALTVDKAKRYATVAAFAADIEKYQSGFATTAEEAGLFTQVRLLVQRHRREFAIGFAAWLVITALAVWFVINLRAKERRAVAGEEAAKVSAAVAITEKEAARRSAATANLNVADAALREGDSAAMQVALNAVPEDLRDSTWGYLLGQSDTSIARLQVSDAAIQGVAAHPRLPGVFAVVDERRKVTLLELRTGTRLLEFTAELSARFNQRAKYSLAISPDGERIAVGITSGDRIVVHSARDGKKLAEWEVPSTEQLQFSGDGRLLLQRSKASGTRGHLAMWDSASGQLRWKYEPRLGNAHAFGAFTPDGQQVVTVGRGDDLRLVQAKDGTLVRTIISKETADNMTPLRALTVGSGDLLAMVDELKSVAFVNWREGRLVSRFQHEVAGNPELHQLAWQPDGTQIVTAVMAGDGRQAIRVWNAATGSLVRTLLGGSSAVHSLAVHPLSGELVVCGPASRAWSLTGVQPKWTLPFSIRFAFWGSDDVIFMPPGGRGDLPTLQRLRADGGTLIWSPPLKGYRHPHISADGRLAVLTIPGGKKDQIMLLRRDGDRADPAAISSTMLSVSTKAETVRLSPAGGFVAGFYPGGLEWIATEGGKPSVKPVREEIRLFHDVAWLSEQRLLGLVTAKADRLQPGSEERLVVWNSTGEIVQTATHATAMDLLAVAPDGRRFAEAGADKSVRIRDAGTLAVLQEFRAHDGPITALAWHPQRPVLATASSDLTIRLWDLDTGRRLEEFTGPSRPSFDLVFSPSGHLLGCAAPNNPTRIWEPESLRDKPGTPQAIEEVREKRPETGR